MLLDRRTGMATLAAFAVVVAVPKLLLAQTAQNVIDDFTQYTYSVPAGPIGSFADFLVSRTFPSRIQSIKVTIVDGQADDIGYVGSLLVTSVVPMCAGVGAVVAPVDVTSEVTVNGATASLLLRAQENCCCVTGWGSATQADRRDARLHWEVTLGSALSLAIDHTAPIIPGNSRTEDRRVLTRSDLALHLTSSDPAVSAQGVSILLQSDRGSTDTINGPGHPTDAAGQASAQVETRDQQSQSTITASNTDIETTQPAVIQWLPADYENNFMVTCYVISDENDFLATRLVTGVCGLPPQNAYHQGFIQDVRLQGSGRALNGEIVHYAGRNCYEILPCAQTTSGACAQEGTTIAVDPKVVPLGSSVNVAILGNRVAQDTGGGINVYHIDNFRGMDRAGCVAFGRQRSAVRFLSY